MRRITLIIMSLACALVLFACSKSENTSNANANKSTAAEKSAGTSGTATTTASTDKIATYGLAALVAGGIAAKAGLFKGLLIALLARQSQFEGGAGDFVPSA